MDSVLTQLITLTTPGPLTYIMLFGYTILYIVGVENIREYCSLKVQSLKKKVDEEKIVELEKEILLKELSEKAEKCLKSYEGYTNGRLIVDGTILDHIVEVILIKQKDFKEIMKTKESALLKKRLEEKAMKS